MDAAVSMVEAEGLSKADGPVKVYKKKLPDTADVDFPCVLVTLEGCKEVLQAIETEKDERVLPVQVHLLDRQDLRSQTDLSRWLSFVQSIGEAFLMQLMEDVPEVWHVEVRPMETLMAQEALGPKYMNAASSWLIEARAITPRRRAS